MNLLEIAHTDPVTMTAQQPISLAVDLMSTRNVGAVVVIDDAKRVVGILTDRDVAMALGKGQSTIATPVSQIMTRNVYTIWRDQGIFNATQYMLGHKVRRLPIIDREERLVGIVSSDDLIGLLGRELLNVAKSFEPALGTQV